MFRGVGVSDLRFETFTDSGLKGFRVEGSGFQGSGM